jgi:hypothetical protein
MGSNVKKGDWFYSKVYKHAKYQRTLAFCNWEIIDAQLAHGMVGKKPWKVVQFSTKFHLMQ